MLPPRRAEALESAYFLLCGALAIHDRLLECVRS